MPESASKKIAEALFKGQAIRIEGGAYESGTPRPVITDVNNIDEAVKLQLEGKLPNLVDKLH
jgi:hypothetical protein